MSILVMDETWVREPRLMVPGLLELPFTANLRVRRDLIGWGLKAFWVFQNGIVTKDLSGNGCDLTTSYAAGTYGPGPTSWLNAGGYATRNSVPDGGPTEITHFAGVVPTGEEGVEKCIIGFAGGRSRIAVTGYQYQTGVYNGAWSQHYYTAAQNEKLILVGAARAGSHILAVNGRLIATSYPSSAPQLTSPNVGVCDYPGFGYTPSYQRMYFAGYFNKALPTALAVELSSGTSVWFDLA